MTTMGAHNAERADRLRDEVGWLHGDLDAARAEVASLATEVERLKGAVDRVLVLHERRDDPRHGCCAPPKLCDGHPPECRHCRVAWPCPTVAALSPSTDDQKGAWDG